MLNRNRIRESNGRLADQTNPALSLDVAVPLNNGAGLEDSLFHVFNLHERASESAALPLPPKPSDPSEAGWHVGISPYIWFSGLHGTVGVLGHEASVHASFGDIFSYLNIGLMVAVEPRYNRIVMPFDFMWMKLSDEKALPFATEAGGTTIKAKLNQTIIAQKIGYRVIDTEKFKVDALAGIRYWHVGTTLDLVQPATTTSFYDSANWVDGVGGARIQAMLSPKISCLDSGRRRRWRGEFGLPDSRAPWLEVKEIYAAGWMEVSVRELSARRQRQLCLRRDNVRLGIRYDHSLKVDSVSPVRLIAVDYTIRRSNVRLAFHTIVPSPSTSAFRLTKTLKV